MSNPPAGWYDDPQVPGRKRWFDGNEWTEHYQSAPVPPPAPQYASGPMTSSKLNVRREVVYNRQQTPHSITKWILISCCTGIGFIWVIYYSMSPNHYWKA